MKARLFLLIVFSISDTCAQVKHTEYNSFLKSFRDLTNQEVLNFRKLSQSGVRMNKNETLKFVYKRESDIPFCKQEIFNSESEEIVGYNERQFLPEKTFMLRYSTGFIIGVKKYLCDQANSSFTETLVIELYDRHFSKVDSRLVYSGDDFDNSINGMLNTKTMSLFVLEGLNTLDSRKAFFLQ
jgi:hypothetical protein